MAEASMFVGSAAVAVHPATYTVREAVCPRIYEGFVHIVRSLKHCKPWPQLFNRDDTLQISRCSDALGQILRFAPLPHSGITSIPRSFVRWAAGDDNSNSSRRGDGRTSGETSGRSPGEAPGEIREKSENFRRPKSGPRSRFSEILVPEMANPETIRRNCLRD